MAALTAAGLRAVAVDEAITALRALVEHRDDVVKIRTQTANRGLAVLLAAIGVAVAATAPSRARG